MFNFGDVTCWVGQRGPMELVVVYSEKFNDLHHRIQNRWAPVRVYEDWKRRIVCDKMIDTLITKSRDLLCKIFSFTNDSLPKLTKYCLVVATEMSVRPSLKVWFFKYIYLFCCMNICIEKDIGYFDLPLLNYYCMQHTELTRLPN